MQGYQVRRKINTTGRAVEQEQPTGLTCLGERPALRQRARGREIRSGRDECTRRHASRCPDTPRRDRTPPVRALRETPVEIGAAQKPRPAAQKPEPNREEPTKTGGVCEEPDSKTSGARNRNGNRGVLSGKPRRTTACLRASAVGKETEAVSIPRERNGSVDVPAAEKECAHLARSTARKTRGGGGELSEKSSSSDGVPAVENRGALSGRLRLNRGPACSPRETGFARSTYRRKLSEPQAKTEAARNPA
jgi:hypothetical protein